MGEIGHSKLRRLTVGIVGVGGIGSNSAMLCAQLGLRELILIDRDKVSQTDFNRQQYYEGDLGKPKVEALRGKIAKMNSDVKVDVHFDQFSDETSSKFKSSSIILDGTDNYSTRVLINRFCLKESIPWIFASALKFEGMLSTILPPKSACFECWAKKPRNEHSCEDAGIMNAAVSTLAALQVSELVNLVCFNKPIYANKLLRVNLLEGAFEAIGVDKNPKCEACSRK